MVTPFLHIHKEINCCDVWVSLSFFAHLCAKSTGDQGLNGCSWPNAVSLSADADGGSGITGTYVCPSVTSSTSGYAGPDNVQLAAIEKLRRMDHRIFWRISLLTGRIKC